MGLPEGPGFRSYLPVCGLNRAKRSILEHMEGVELYVFELTVQGASPKAVPSYFSAPHSGRRALFEVPVSTIFVKLLVSFWLVGGLVEGQKIIR